MAAQSEKRRRFGRLFDTGPIYQVVHPANKAPACGRFDGCIYDKITPSIFSLVKTDILYTYRKYFQKK